MTIRPAALCLAVLLVHGVAFADEPAAPRPWLGGQKELKGGVRSFLSRTVDLATNAGSSEASLSLEGDRISVSETQMGGTSWIECNGSAPFKLSGTTLSVRCSTECVENYSQMRGPAPSKRLPRGDFALDLRFHHVTDEVMIASNDTGRWVFGTCGVANPWVGTEKCDGVYMKDLSGSLVQVIPGAKDRALFTAVKREVGTMMPGEKLLTFEGAPAGKPRVESEVFYVGESTKGLAEKVAAALAPVIGKVAVKQWPGAWDFDVVVVVGSQLAASK